VAFDGTGALGDGEPGGDGGPVLAEASAETAQLADRAGLSVAGPCFQALAAAVAEHVGELADQIAGRFELFAAGGDLREVGTVVVGEVAGRGEDPTGRLVGRRCSTGRWAAWACSSGPGVGWAATAGRLPWCCSAPRVRRYCLPGAITCRRSLMPR
jgi:hypothetical protein